MNQSTILAAAFATLATTTALTTPAHAAPATRSIDGAGSIDLDPGLRNLAGTYTGSLDGAPFVLELGYDAAFELAGTARIGDLVIDVRGTTRSRRGRQELIVRSLTPGVVLRMRGAIVGDGIDARVRAAAAELPRRIDESVVLALPDGASDLVSLAYDIDQDARGGLRAAFELSAFGTYVESLPGAGAIRGRRGFDDARLKASGPRSRLKLRARVSDDAAETAISLRMPGALGRLRTSVVLSSAPDLRALIAPAQDALFTTSFRSGVIPDFSNGPSIQVESAAFAITGGSQSLRVRSAEDFDTVYVSLVGVDGFFTWTSDVPLRTADLLLLIDQDALAVLGVEEPTLEAQCKYALARGGRIGAVITQPITIGVVGGGDVQVSVAWDAPSDVDLHVVDPTGEDTYYGNDVSLSGGRLDLDSNAGCGIDGVQNENITWADGTAPTGTYRVLVDYWSDCGVAETNYTVTVRVGGTVRTYSGRFEGLGDGGGAFSGVEVATFEVR